MLIEDFIKRLRAICDSADKEYTFEFSIKPDLSKYLGLDQIIVDVFDNNKMLRKNIFSAEGVDLVDLLKTIERKLLPANEIVVINGQKFMKVDINDNGKHELLKIK